MQYGGGSSAAAAIAICQGNLGRMLYKILALRRMNCLFITAGVGKSELLNWLAVLLSSPPDPPSPLPPFPQKGERVANTGFLCCFFAHPPAPPMIIEKFRSPFFLCEKIKNESLSVVTTPLQIGSKITKIW